MNITFAFQFWNGGSDFSRLHKGSDAADFVQQHFNTDTIAGIVYGNNSVLEDLYNTILLNGGYVHANPFFDSVTFCTDTDSITVPAFV